MIRDWKKQIVTFDFSLSANDLWEILDDLDEEDASEIIIEYLDNNEKCQAIVRKWMVEE